MSTTRNTKRYTKSQIRKSRIRAIVVGLGFLVSCLSTLAVAQRVLLDKIIAIVDADVVLQSELESKIRGAQEMSVRESRELPPADELRQELLNSLIIENLQLQFADRVNIRFDDDTVNRVLQDMATNNNLSFDEYVTLMQESGVYLQTREEVRKQMVLQELQRGIVNSRIAITDQEIENFLNSETGKEVLSADFFVDHILVAKSATDGNEVVAEKLRYSAALIARIEEGEEFLATRIAAAQEGRHVISGTDFGWRKADQLPNIFSEIVEGMAIGDIEGPIEAGNGFHIIRLAGKRGGSDQLMNQTHMRHIMLTPNEIRNEEDTIKEIGALRERILAGEEFSPLARQNSEDFSSVVAGGDLGYINKGGMPAEMEVVVDLLEVGVLSEPFESSTGWHIAEVIDRRVTDLSQEYARQQAENALRDRKFDLELQNWIIEIREEAFVEFVE
ncbi:MAG: peptidylprolyl isomerase [Gammaproteobacteria bacterium]|jgi:peptidyl-prolyl cis-trans isomerase SurA|nr:peptidylprolyl isomerase [Gammaproteobacteria bacterium]